MPELPELEIYRERLEEAIAGRRVVRAHAHDAFVLRTVAPPLESLSGRTLSGVRRCAKFLVLRVGPADDGSPPDRIDVAFHLMLAGRLHLREAEAWKPHRRRTIFSMEFAGGPLLEMTEAGTKRRASVRLLGPGDDRGKLERGVDPLDPKLDAEALGRLLRLRNRQLATALRDPDLLSGIGNAFKDEILFAARLSPVKLTARLDEDEVGRLHAALREVLPEWIDRVRGACPAGLPTRQADWRRDMAVHGKAGEPCPACGGPIGLIARRESETNYCPACQTEGRLLADRRLSRLGVRRLPPRKT